MKKKVAQVIINIAAWICFLLLPFVFFSRPKESSFLPEQPITFYFVVSNLLFIAFYYFNGYFLIPRLLARERIIFYSLVIISLMIFFGMIPRLYDYLSDSFLHLPPSPWRLTRSPGPNLRRPILSPGSISVFLLVFVISTGVHVVGQWFQSEKRAKEIENEKLSTELSFLKSQINPHFLFNTLNNIYSLAANQSDKTAEAVMKLSSIMRYVLTEAKNETVPLEKEILFIKHYIELQKLRLTEKSCLDFKIEGNPEGKQVSPLLFLPFVENAFKYGISTRDSSPIKIAMEIKNPEVHFLVKNNKHNGTLLKRADNTGIGITNVKRRLDLLYPGKYKLDIADETASYTVNLNIKL
ncbi:MAG: sensor histidine kinase [Bacteroidetes bacterium]|nr:sensor histidine kinase [Bacteroidota bacterium]MBS1933490.1 sensor histidine kinase [Bacteroidota bacterium]